MCLTMSNAIELFLSLIKSAFLIGKPIWEYIKGCAEGLSGWAGKAEQLGEEWATPANLINPSSHLIS